MAITNKFDYKNRIKMIVSMASKVQKNEITEHDASVHGQVLVDDIVKPQSKKKAIKVHEGLLYNIIIKNFTWMHSICIPLQQSYLYPSFMSINT